MDITIFGDFTLDASADPRPGTTVSVFRLCSETAVRLPHRSRPTDGADALIADVPSRDAEEVRINADDVLRPQCPRAAGLGGR